MYWNQTGHRRSGWQWWPPSAWLLALAVSPMCPTGCPAAGAMGGIIAEGRPYATPYFVRDTGIAGPAVLVVGGMHGDEPAGAAAADQVRHWPIVRGKLVVVPRANMLALAAQKRLTPEEPAPTANLNRDFPEPGGPETARGALANALWSFVREQKPDWLIDLHEGTDFRASGSQSVGSSIIVFPTPQARTAATQMLAVVNASITNREQTYVLLNMPIRGSLARAAGAHLGAHAMILESSTKGQPLSCRTRQHRILVRALLRHLGMMDDRVTSAWLMPQPPSPGQIRVAVFRSELAKNGTPKGVMVDSPAIVTGRFGRGRVLCSSPHLEQSKGWEAFIPRAVTWVAGEGREPRKN